MNMAGVTRNLLLVFGIKYIWHFIFIFAEICVKDYCQFL